MVITLIDLVLQRAFGDYLNMFFVQGSRQFRFWILISKFSIKDFFCKCDQICSFLRIWSYLLKKAFRKTSFFCSALIVTISYETFFQSLYSKRCMKNITQGSLGS